MTDLWTDSSLELAQSAGVLLLLAVLGWVVSRAGDRVVARTAVDDAERHQRISTLWLAGKRIMVSLLVVLGVLTVMGIWDIPITALLAVGSTVGIAVGFGAQGMVKDVIAGLLILSEGQFDIGDTVTVAETTGTVTDIRLRITVMRDLNGTVHFIPNGRIQVASNFTKGFSRAVIDIPVAYDTDLTKVKAVLEDEMALMETELDSLIIEPGVVMGVDKLDDSSIIVRVLLTTEADSRWSVKRIALERFVNRFRLESIEIPFNTVNVISLNGEGPPE